MHEAFEVSSLLKLTEQIESIAAYDDNLLLGTRQGHLLMYLVTPSTEGQKYNIQVLRYHKTFSKKPIQQIEVIPERNLLLCLSDNILVVHDLHIINFPVIQTLPLTKGATLFAIDNTPTTSLTGEVSVIRLCVAVKRKLQMYCLKNGEFRQLCSDISVGDIPRVMMWGESIICVGFKEEYILYSFLGEVKEQFLSSSSKSQEPCIIKLSATSFMLGRDQSSVVIDEKNLSTLSKTVVKWNAPLIAAVWNDPYILGLLNDQIVVQTMTPNTFVQTLSDLNKARLLCRCQNGLLYAASIGQVWRISAVELTKQRQMLLKDKQFEMALKLTNNSTESEEEKKQIINSIQMLYAFDLFHNKKFSESMKIFLKLETDPTEVITLIPELSSSGSKSPGDQSVEDEPPDPYLESKYLALIEYLTEVRHKVQVIGPKRPDKESHISQQAVLETIDTTLLKCYLQTNDAFVGPLLRLNNCRLNEAEEVLLQYNKFFELTILYQTKGQHLKALQLLMDQSKQADYNLKGHHRTKVYLQHLGAEHINLIFKFSDWVLKEQPEEGLKIFTEDIQEVENLPRPKVLDFLLREHEALAIPYLEHIIHVWQDKGSIFHNALVRMLREKVMDKTGAYSEGQQQNMRVKLLAFLEKSNYYTPETVLVHFPTDALFEERAAILEKLENHEQALSIYVHILGDVDRAVRYCDTICDQHQESNEYQDVYIILIKMLVNPNYVAYLNGPLGKVPRTPKTMQPDINTALSLLDLHGDKINPLKAIAVLPDSVPLSRLSNYIAGAYHNLLNSRRNAQVIQRLLYAEHLQVQELKMIHESQKVVIDTYNICSVCKKRFGNQSAFVRYPNGEIVHYSCHVKKQ